VFAIVIIKLDVREVPRYDMALPFSRRHKQKPFFGLGWRSKGPLAQFSNAYDSSLISLLSLADARQLGHRRQYLIYCVIIDLASSLYMAIIPTLL